MTHQLSVADALTALGILVTIIAARLTSMDSGAKAKPERKGGIVARDVTSREGGMRVDETTGSGIELEKVNVKDDVNLSSSKAHDSSAGWASETQPSMGLSARALIAGGNITIQQFVGNQAAIEEQLAFFARQIGLTNPRQDFGRSQFEAYSDVWKACKHCD